MKNSGRQFREDEGRTWAEQILRPLSCIILTSTVLVFIWAHNIYLIFFWRVVGRKTASGVLGRASFESNCAGRKEIRVVRTSTHCKWYRGSQCGRFIFHPDCYGCELYSQGFLTLIKTILALFLWVGVWLYRLHKSTFFVFRRIIYYELEWHETINIFSLAILTSN